MRAAERSNCQYEQLQGSQEEEEEEEVLQVLASLIRLITCANYDERVYVCDKL